MEAPRYCFCKGRRGQAGKALQDICTNGNKDIPSWFCSQKQSFQRTLTFQTSSTLRAGTGTASQVHCVLGSICFCLETLFLPGVTRTKPNHCQSTPSAPPLLWLSETYLEIIALDTHFSKPFLRSVFPCSPSILPLQTPGYLPKTYLQQRNFIFFFPKYSLLKFSPQISFVHCTLNTS